MESIPVIDLFAGPGGLSEGFSSLYAQDGRRLLKVVLSIEKDTAAYKTLLLRSFFRQFNIKDVPADYYRYLWREISLDILYDRHPVEASKARNEVWCAELGNKYLLESEIDTHIRRALSESTKWVLIGGPPCQAYSIMGRSRMKGIKPEEFERDERHFLYREYLRIISRHAPPVFVMENVPGLLSSRVQGTAIFERMLSDLRMPYSVFPEKNSNTFKANNDLRYKIYSFVKSTYDPDFLQPADYIIKSEQYGIPQRRHRVILLGVRHDLDVTPNTLTPEGDVIPVHQIINDLPAIRSMLSKEKDSFENWRSALKLIVNSELFNKAENQNELTNLIAHTVECFSNELGTGALFLPGASKTNIENDWVHDPRLGGTCNHSSRRHIRSDLYRYLFATCYAMVYNRSPKLSDFPADLLPSHLNVDRGVKGEMFSDRFRVQLESQPSTTITAHISKDGHYYIHPDPRQCRTLTVREAARLQTFPDNYFFEGNQTEQYKQVGNAVPPLLAKRLASVVYDVLLSTRL